jgi:peroxiredoxin Q/BCP
MVKPSIGKVAPAFTALDQNGDKVALKDFRGQRVILYFYPKAMTPGCTTQACGLRDESKALKQANVAVIGISPDSPERLKRFETKAALNFTLLSDENHALAEKYGVWGPKKFMGRTFDGIHRTTFIVDEAGKLRHIIDKVKTKTHHQDVLDWIAEHLDA